MVATPILHMYKRSSQDYHTKSKDNKNLPHTKIQHTQQDPFKGNMKLRTSFYLFLYYLVLLPNKLLEHCFHVLFYQGTGGGGHMLYIAQSIGMYVW